MSVQGTRFVVTELTPDASVVILDRQNPSGSFSGDRFGETDTRFTYIALNGLSLLGKLHLLDVERTVSHLRNCRNFDGGFGSSPGAESHSGQGAVFAVATY